MKNKWTLGKVIEFTKLLVEVILKITWLIIYIGIFIYNWKLGFIVGLIWMFVDWMRKPIVFKTVAKK